MELNLNLTKFLNFVYFNTGFDWKKRQLMRDTILIYFIIKYIKSQEYGNKIQRLGEI